MAIIVPTVKHSGSHYVADHLFQKHRKVPLKAAHEAGKQDVVFDHLFDTKMDLFDELLENEENPIVIPIRHPKVVALSWDMLKQDRRPYYFDQWDNLTSIADKYADRIAFVVLDGGAALLEACVENVAELTGARMPRKLDEVVASRAGTHQKSAAQISYDELLYGAEVELMVRNMEPFLNRLYHPADSKPEPDETGDGAGDGSAQDAAAAADNSEAPPKEPTKRGRRPAMFKHKCPEKGGEEVSFPRSGACPHCGAEAD